MTNAELKAAIVAAVYENTEGAITGDALQNILLKIVDQFETPVIVWDNITLNSGTGTAAGIAELLGVSEDVVNRMADGLIPEIIFYFMGYSGTVFLSTPNQTTREYSGANGFGFSIILARASLTEIYFSFSRS